MPLVARALAIFVSATAALGATEARAEPHRVCPYLDLGAELWDAAIQMELDR